MTDHPHQLLVEKALHADLCAPIVRTSPGTWDVGAALPHSVRLLQGGFVTMMVVTAVDVPVSKALLLELNEQNAHHPTVLTTLWKRQVHVRSTVSIYGGRVPG